MPTINRFAQFHDEITAWRRDLHQHPEILFDVHRTAGVVAEKLKAFGADEVVTGIGRTGVVGVIHGRTNKSGKVVALRADMDALPIKEIRDLPHKSTVDGKMHACGHDGHTAMLLGAAKYLAETRNFDGTVVVIFQPAEEGGGGGKEMVDDGMMERFGVQEVYGMHNMPGLPVGQFAIRPGGLMASADFFTIHIEGKGGHAARPHGCIDPAMTVAQIVQGFQSIVSRNTDPLESLVISVTQIHMGDANNVIPQTAWMNGTVRALKPQVREQAEARMKAMCQHIGAAHDTKVTIEYTPLYPVTVNHDRQTAFAASVAREIAGEGNVETNTPPVMGAEDFSFMLEARPGAFIFIGQGESAGLHHPEYDFNDDIIPIGCSYWAKLVETAMPANG
ncbi:MAG: M20 aminoacylase family protein [Anderseniella sp.]|jgi:hippurate hydrolase|nr:M20 aminoacylase family protein [Anderseniella sp.]